MDIQHHLAAASMSALKKSIILCLLYALALFADSALGNPRISLYTKQKLLAELPAFGLAVGDEILLRAFKSENQLELWMHPAGKQHFVLFRTYPICKYSGQLGPKLHEGDGTTPEGFYNIDRHSLNPHSRYYLSINIGYPNTFDRYHGHTGSSIMIHGACQSIGCFAMGNSQIEEIYFLIEQAIKHGQRRIALHAFPFRMTDSNMHAYRNNPWYAFWQELKIGYDRFNQEKVALNISVLQGRYNIALP